MTFKQYYWAHQKPFPPVKFYRDIIRDILAVTKQPGKKNKDLVVLDVGSGLGKYSYELSKRVKQVVGVEPDRNTFKLAIPRKNLTFYNTLIEKFDTKQRFDLVVSGATLEHMPDANASFKRIFKLLKVGGIIYITTPNKLWPYEYHYRLWFLSYLPLSLANLYVRMAGKGKSYQDSSYSMTYFGIKKFFNQFPCQYKFVLPDPKASYLKYSEGSNIVRVVGIRLLKYFPFLWVFSKSFIMVVRKTA